MVGCGSVLVNTPTRGPLFSRPQHEGPVRSVDFHGTQPLFVSGGDDYKVGDPGAEDQRQSVDG